MIIEKCKSAARALALCGLATLGGCSAYMPLLGPKGPIGAAEKTTMLTAVGLMLIVVIPVFALTFLIAWRYRASNKKATYAPNWSYSGKIELVVWLVPALIVLTLGRLTWNTTHALSPYKPLVSTRQPIRIDAVAMNWKWLFIYPDQHIATVNEVVFPKNTPVSFRLTSQTVMASFFIPSLGSQIYAMPGMRTKLHLLADQAGTYVGRNFQFSGRGYSSMHFQAVAKSEQGFQAWVRKVQASQSKLDPATLRALERPSRGMAVTYYGSAPPDLFDHIIDQFVMANAMRPKSHA